MQSYADADALKAWMRIPEASDVDDTELNRALSAASRQIDHLCSRSFTVAVVGPPEDRGITFEIPIWDRNVGAWVLPIPDLMDATVGTGGLELFQWNENAADWTTAIDLSGPSPLRPLNAATKGMPWTSVVLPSGSTYSQVAPAEAEQNNILIRANFGWLPGVPDAVVQACLIQAARLVKRRDALFGIVGAPDGSDATRLLDRMDADAVSLLRLGGFIKYWAAR